MKYLFISLLLLSIPAHANKIYSNQECLEMYRAMVIDFETGKVPPRNMMAYYGQVCIAVNEDGPEHTALIATVLSDEFAAAIKAKLAEHDLIKL